MTNIEVSSRGPFQEIGENCIVDSFLEFNFLCELENIVLNHKANINSGCVFCSGHGIYVVTNTLIAAHCTIAATYNEFSPKIELIREQGFKTSKRGYNH